jgi:hypothetical protein
VAHFAEVHHGRLDQPENSANHFLDFDGEN